MEELLASIRLIISDGDKRDPVGRDLSHRGDAVAPARGPTTAMAPSDEVLDLTDELVFPEPLAAPTVTPAAEPGAPEPAAGQPVKTRAVEELAAPPVLAPEAFAREAFRETRPTAQTRKAPSQQSQGPAQAGMVRTRACQAAGPGPGWDKTQQRCGHVAGAVIRQLGSGHPHADSR